MRSRVVIASIALLFIAGTCYYWLTRPSSKQNASLNDQRTRSRHFIADKSFFAINEREHEEEEEERERQQREEDFTPERLKHEFQMLRNPITGTIPANIHEIEARVANSIPARRANASQATRTGDIANQNAYTSVGPDNIGGRSRTLAFDRRNPSIMLTGGVTGGIFRSTNGGASWTFVSGENDIRSTTSLVQDPTNPNTWYCGTGEVFYSASAADIAGTVGYGIFKSTDNGVSWTKLTATEDANPNQFNGTFDLVHRMAIHPATGHIYAAVHNRIMRSTDGGQTWATVLGGIASISALRGITEVIIPSSGSKIFAAISGLNSDRSVAGVWESATGNVNSWKRIAGGASNQADSVAGWKPFGQWSRIVLALNNANTRLYVLYKNGKDATGSSPQPEADLFRADISSGNSSSYTWTNLNSFVPDESGFNRDGVDPYTTQFFGYNMSISVKPDNDNILFIGGTVLDRVDLTKTTASQKFRRIGGYGVGFFPQEDNFIYPNHHPDIHGIYFPPGANDVIYTVDDGGVQKTTTSTLADTVRWQELNANLQTLQYQNVNIHPDLDADFIAGGAQDNGTTVNLDPNTSFNHTQIQGGDGASTALSQFFKTGNNWKQYWYTSIVQGYIERADLTWDASSGDLNLTAFTRTEITPSGIATDEGQWLTLFVNDPDSSNQLYYNWQNRFFRTRSASTVTPSTWTEITGFSNTLSSSENGTAMAISKARNGVKYLYIGTNAGKVYRFDNANIAPASATPVSITPSAMAAGSYVAGVSINPRSPDTVLVVVSSYDATNAPVNNIFWTGNATATNPTWQVLDDALAPVSVQSCAIVLKTSGVEYYVGTSVGLYSATTLAGNNTQWFNEGSGMLKKAIVRSLAVRQKDNTLVVGTHGNGAFVTRIGDAVPLGNDVVTGINNPVTNDRNFIRQVYPTLTSNQVFFTVGNMFSVRNITVQLFGTNGQRLYEAWQAYQNGAVNIATLPKGTYVLQITSNDGKYRHLQKIVKQ